jgi:hypothetical protein
VNPLIELQSSGMSGVGTRSCRRFAAPVVKVFSHLGFAPQAIALLAVEPVAVHVGGTELLGRGAIGSE